MIKISFNHYQATINELGAQLVSLLDQQTQHEYLWQGDPEYWRYQAPILFPFVGRLKDDEYHYAGKTYHQTQHGFAREYQFTIDRQTEHSVTLVLTDTLTTQAVYPFKFKLTVSYQLDEQGLHIDYRVENRATKQTLLFALGAHPGFNVANTTFNTSKVKVRPNQIYNQIPLVGPYNDAEHSQQLDLTNPLQLSHELFRNDAIILALNGQPVELTLTDATEQHGINIRLTDTPFVGIWSPYPKQAPLVCIEPWWGIADNLNTDKALTHKMAINQLSADKQWHAGFSIQIF